MGSRPTISFVALAAILLLVTDPQTAFGLNALPPHWSAFLYNIDDTGRVLLNGMQVGRTLGYKQTGYIELTPSLKSGTNAITIEFSNTVGTYTWGYTFIIDAISSTKWADRCGLVGSIPCNNGSTQLGIILSRQFSLQYYSVPGTIPILKQVKNTCWAFAATMMLSWRDHKTYNADEVVHQVGPKYEALLKSGGVLDFADANRFFNTLGLVVAPPQSQTATTLSALLQAHGPIWVTTAPKVGHAVSVHARILFAVSGDGSLDNTYLSLIDPAVGAQQTETLRTFTKYFEQIAASDSGTDAPTTPQVLYLR